MTENVFAIILDERRWLPFSMIVALLAVTGLGFRYRLSAAPTRRRILTAMNLFFGVTVGMMAFGHLLAISGKLGMGTLEGEPVLLYAIGVALALPSWSLVVHAWRVASSAREFGPATMGLNVWLAGTLMVFGIHNLPLAMPAALNIAYQMHVRRRVGWAVVGLTVVAHVALFVASVWFFASGQTFEQFRG